MVTTASYATSQTQIGLAAESSRGTPAQPSFWLPVKAPKYKPELLFNPDEGLRGSMVTIYDEIPGMRMDTHGWDSFPYMDTFPNLIKAELGSPDTLTAAPASTTLAAAPAAGDSTISTTASIAAGSYIVIDVASSGKLETHLTTTVSGTGPYTVGLTYPLNYAHSNGVAVTGLTKHQFSLLNNSPTTGDQPPSYTITDFDGEEWRQIAAAQLDKLTIKGTGTGVVDYTCNWFGNPAITPATPTASYTSTEAVPAWTSTIAIAGTKVGYVVDWEIDLGRGVKPIPAMTGTQGYYEYFAGPIASTAKITVVEQANAPELTKYLTNQTLALDITCYDVVSGFALNFHSSTAKFTTGELDRGQEWVQAVLDVQLLPSSTDALAGGVSPILVTCANGQTATF